MTNPEIINALKALLLPRLIEEKMLILLRQGKISKWFSGIGQEAISVGSTLAMDKNEFILHYDLYRNFLTYPLYDLLFYKQMEITLQEDIDILNGIYDNYIKGFMNTKFDITQLKYRERWNKHFMNEDKYLIKKNNTKNIF